MKLIKVVFILSILVLILTKDLKESKKKSIDNKDNEKSLKESKERKVEEQGSDKSSETTTADKKSNNDSTKTSKERKNKKEDEEATKSAETVSKESKDEKKDNSTSSKERKAKKEEDNKSEETKPKNEKPAKKTETHKTSDNKKADEITVTKRKFERVNLKRKQELINNIPGKTTTFDMGVEAETIGDPSQIQLQQQPENPPKPLKEQEDIPSLEDENPADKASLEVTGVGKMGPPPKELKLEPVSYVKELSPVGKMQLELQESGDIEYQKLLNAGFETPKVISTLIDNKATKVVRAANVEYNWNPIDPRNNNLWANVEFNKYGNRLLDTHRYSTPAKFEKNMFGNVVVHAPSDSRLQITTPSSTTLSGFLSVEEGENLVNEEDFVNSLVYDDQ